LKDIRWATLKLAYDPLRVVSRVVDKMIRAGNDDRRKAMLIWKFETLAGRDRKQACR